MRITKRQLRNIIQSENLDEYAGMIMRGQSGAHAGYVSGYGGGKSVTVNLASDADEHDDGEEINETDDDDLNENPITMISQGWRLAKQVQSYFSGGEADEVDEEEEDQLHEFAHSEWKFSIKKIKTAKQQAGIIIRNILREQVVGYQAPSGGKSYDDSMGDEDSQGYMQIGDISVPASPSDATSQKKTGSRLSVEDRQQLRTQMADLQTQRQAALDTNDAKKADYVGMQMKRLKDVLNP